MWRNSDRTIGVTGGCALQRGDNLAKTVGVVDESFLPFEGIGATKTAETVQYRQGGKADADVARRLQALQALFGAVSVGAAVDGVVQDERGPTLQRSLAQSGTVEVKVEDGNGGELVEQWRVEVGGSPAD